MDEILDVRDMEGEINEDPEIDVNAISEVYCKWKKLPYTSATWSSPPTADDSSNEDFVSAMDSYRKRLKVVPPKQQRKNRKQFVELTTQPECMQNGSLYSHQLEGLNWLLYRYYKSEGCVLADDMGLGKTIQIIGLFATIFKKHGSFPFLIVVPNSTVQNWQREFQKWAPQLVTVCYSGLGKEKQIVKDYLLFNRKKVMFHVVIATYETATTELATLKRAGRYEILVVDEGQRLKNDSSKLFGKLVELDVGHKILLTGTPLQNNLREIFNLMNFLDPDNFPDTEALEKKYNVLNEDAVLEIQKMLKPYILRRTKQEVLKDFPNLTEIIVPVGMSPLQKTIYKSILQKNITVLKAISNAKPGTNKGNYRSLHNSLMEVRKCLNHPYLVVPEQRYVSNLQQNRTANCGKFQFLHDLLPKLKAAGNRVLIFSQMVILLNELEDFIYDEGYKYVRFDGTTSQLDRQERIDAFNAEGSELFIFLISTRAGGVGINLATADTVIIYDVDFNPHQDLQAISRAHRIGQNKKLLVLKLMTKNSAEERIMQIGKKKLILDHLIIETMNRKEDEEPVDVASILKYGAQALFAEEGDPAEAEKMIKYTSAEIDAILAHREDAKAETKENSVGGFGFARIWLNEAAVELADEDEKAAADAKYWDTLAEKLTKDNPKHLELGRGARKRNRLNYAEHLDNSPKKNDIRPQKRPDSDLEVDIDFVPPAVDSTSDSSDDTGMDAETLLFKEKKKLRSYSPESTGIDSMEPLDNPTLTPTAGLPNVLPTHAQVHHRPIDPIQQVRPSSTKKRRGKGTLHNSGPKNPNYSNNHDSNVMGPIMPRSTLNLNATKAAANSPVILQMSHSHSTSSLPPLKKLRTYQVNRVPNSTTVRHPLTTSSSPHLPPGYTTPFANTPNIATGAFSAETANAYHRMVPTLPLQSDIDQSPMISSHPQDNMSYNLNATIRPVDSLVQRNVDPSRIALNSANKVENPNAMYPNVNAPQRKGLPYLSSPISNDASFANARTKNGGSAAKLNMRDTVANGGYVQGNGGVGSAPSASKLGGTISATFSGTRTPQRTGLSNSTASGPTSGARSSTGGYKGSFDLPNMMANSAHVQRNNDPSPSRFAKPHAGKNADGSLPGVSPAPKGLPILSSSNLTNMPLSSGPTTNNGLTGTSNLENMAANSANKFASDEQLACFNCKITKSKVWRAGFGLRRRLCNECGLHYAKTGHHRRVDVCWCCCRKHGGECDDMRSVLKLLERKAAVNNDKSLDERQRRELGIKLDQALKNAHSNGASPLPVRDHRTSTHYDVRPPNTATHTTPPLPFANMAREFRSKGGGNVPASATPTPLQQQQSQAKVNQPTASGTPTQPSLTQPGRSSAALNYTYTGCVICRSPKHNLGSCPSRLDSEVVRSQHAKILADELIPLAKRAELASGLALYMNNRVVMKTSRPSR